MANRININMASSKELEQLPRIGQVAAGRIIANRPYNKIEDLSQVQGISAKTVEEISHLISLNEETEDDVIALLPTGGADNLEGEMEEIEVDAGDETVNELAEELIPVERTEMVELEDEDAPVDEPLLPEDAPGEGGETELEDEAAPVDEPLPPEDAPDEDEETEREEMVSTPVPDTKKKERKAKRELKMISQADAVLLSVGSSVAALLLSLALTLLVLGAINGGLSYVRPGQLADINNEMIIANKQIAAIQDDIDSLQTRVDLYEAVSGRVTTLETDITSVKTDLVNAQQAVDDLQTSQSEMDTEMEEINSQLAAISTQSEELAGQVAELQVQTNGFQEFLTGLRDLLGNIVINPFGGDK